MPIGVVGPVEFGLVVHGCVLSFQTSHGSLQIVSSHKLRHFLRGVSEDVCRYIYIYSYLYVCVRNYIKLRFPMFFALWMLPFRLDGNHFGKCMYCECSLFVFICSHTHTHISYAAICMKTVQNQSCLRLLQFSSCVFFSFSPLPTRQS